MLVDGGAISHLRPCHQIASNVMRRSSRCGTPEDLGRRCGCSRATRRRRVPDDQALAEGVEHRRRGRTDASRRRDGRATSSASNTFMLPVPDPALAEVSDPATGCLDGSGGPGRQRMANTTVACTDRVWLPGMHRRAGRLPGRVARVGQRHAARSTR